MHAKTSTINNYYTDCLLSRTICCSKRYAYRIIEQHKKVGFPEKEKGTEGLVYFEGKQVSKVNRSTRYKRNNMPVVLKALKGLGNKNSKIHQITSVADTLGSKINGNSSARRQKFLWPAKDDRKKFWHSCHIGICQHDYVQNKRSLGTNLSQLN